MNDYDSFAQELAATAAADQAGAGARNMARLVLTYYRTLVSGGMCLDHALVLTNGFQNIALDDALARSREGE